MKKPDIPENEQSRLSALRSLNILDTPPEERFDRLTRLARRLFEVPIALISLIDENRQWFKSCTGLSTRETSRDISFCGHAILGDSTFIIPDALEDERFADNPLVVNEPHIRFYAGCPLRLADGNVLGTLCIIDTKPRTLNEDDLQALKDLAETAERELAAVEMATVDDLTGLSNRRGFMIVAEKNLQLFARQHIPVTLCFLDLDKFKEINDSYGHAEGDRALRTFSNQLTSVCRDTDIIARMSGDEFVAFFINTLRKDVEDIITRLRGSLIALEQKEKRGYEITFSHGIVDFDPNKHETVVELLADGDSLMYRFKASRNKNR